MQQFAPSDPAGSAPAPQQKPKSDIKTTIIAWVIVLVVGGLLFYFIGKKVGLIGAPKPSGTYYDAYGTGYVNFIDDKNIRLNTLGLSLDGTYEIIDNTIWIDYKVPLLGTQTVTYKYALEGNTVYLNGSAYTKRD